MNISLDIKRLNRSTIGRFFKEHLETIQKIKMWPSSQGYVVEKAVNKYLKDRFMHRDQDYIPNLLSIYLKIGFLVV
jgi:hypothetical protein